ncbi:MAG: RNA methyltransferase [Pyrinomonadaceae bacterium]|nr:RNA methyltransferase [Pyrinomonadaceae bacterium]
MERETITSRDNARLVNARKVRDGKMRDHVFVEGRRLVEEALRSSVVLDECFAAESFGGAELLDNIASRCEVRRVADRLFASIADTDTPQGIVVIAQRPTATLADIDVAGADVPLVLFLKEINNPSNLGATFRTAEAAGIAGVITSSGSADAFSPKAMRAAMGSNLRLRAVEGVTFDDAIKWARQNGLVTTATAADGALSYVDIDWKQPRLVVLGSESHGLSDRELAAFDATVSISMANDVESLNVGVAAGVMLFEARRQRVSDTKT